MFVASGVFILGSGIVGLRMARYLENYWMSRPKRGLNLHSKIQRSIVNLFYSAVKMATAQFETIEYYTVYSFRNPTSFS